MPISGSSNPRSFTSFDGAVYFQACSCANVGDDVELWRTDGTTETQVSHVRFGDPSDSAATVHPFDDLVTFKGALYFTLRSGINGTQLWRSDGGEPNLVWRWNGASGGDQQPRALSRLTVFDGNLYLFAAMDTGSDNETAKEALWRDDGTTDPPTRIAADLPEGSDLYSSSWGGGGVPSRYESRYQNNGSMAVYRHALYWSFGSSDEPQAETIRSWDGHTVSTVDGSPTGVRDLTVSGGLLYFAAGNPGNEDLWCYENGSVRRLTQSGLGPYGLTDVSETLYFESSDIQLWRSTGTSDGTSLVKQFDPGDGSLNGTLAAIGSSVYFGYGRDLWQSDGTADETRLASVVEGGTPAPTLTDLVAIGPDLYFRAISNQSFNAWRYIPGQPEATTTSPTMTPSSSATTTTGNSSSDTPSAASGVSSGAYEPSAPTVEPPATAVAAAPSRTVTAAAGTSGSLVVGSDSAHGVTVSWAKGAFGLASTTVSATLLPSVAAAKGTSAFEMTVQRDGAAVDHFESPVDLAFPSAPLDVIPAQGPDGAAWTEIPKIVSPPNLHAGWLDGWYRDASGELHILTTHTKFFALLRSGTTVMPALRLTYGVSRQINLDVRHTIVLYVQPTFPATLTATLRRNGHTFATWHAKLTTQPRALLLSLPKGARHVGLDTLQVVVAGAGASVSRQVTLRVIARHLRAN